MSGLFAPLESGLSVGRGGAGMTSLPAEGGSENSLNEGVACCHDGLVRCCRGEEEK